MTLKFTPFPVLCLLIIFSQAQFTTYIHNFDTLTRYSPTFDLGLLSSSISLQIQMNTTLGPNSLSMSQVTTTVHSTTLNPQIVVPCTGGCNSNQCTLICDIQVSTYYQLDIIASGFPVQFQGSNPSQLQPFQLSVTTFPTAESVSSPSSQIILEAT